MLANTAILICCFLVSALLLHCDLCDASLCEIHSLPQQELQRHSKTAFTAREGNARSKRDVQDFEAIRITPIVDATTLPSSNPVVQAVLENALEPALNFMSSALRVKRLKERLYITPQCDTPTGYLYHRSANGSRQVHCQTGCAKATKCGFCSVPDSHLDTCEVCRSLGNGLFDCRNVRDAGTGLNDTDVVIYVQSVNLAGCASNALIAFGQTCQLDAVTDRPVAGCLNICPSSIAALSNAKGAKLTPYAHYSNYSTATNGLDNEEQIIGGYYRQLEYTFRHELTHVLGFMNYLYGFWRDANGAPLTARDAVGLPPFDNATQQYSWSSNVTQTRTIPWRTANGIENRSVHYLVTPNVRREVQAHFRCDDLPGAELENQGGSRTALSHLEKRIFQNEVMSGSDTETRYYSRITLAVLQDTGWYQVTWQAADRWKLGASLGCRFTSRSCGEWIAQRRAAHQSAWPFCDRVATPTWRTDGTFHLTCNAPRSAVSFCTLNRYASPLPSTYQYFQSDASDRPVPFLSPALMADGDSCARYGGNDYTANDITDFCPYVREMQQALVRPPTFQRCANRDAQPPDCANLLLETYGTSSQCLRSLEPWLLANCSGVFSTRVWGSGCYRVTCNAGNVLLHVGKQTLRCDRELQVLAFAVRSQHYSHFGNLMCPLCEHACAARPCPMAPANVSAYDHRLLDTPPHFQVPVTDEHAVLASVAADLRGQPCFNSRCVYVPLSAVGPNKTQSSSGPSALVAALRKLLFFILPLAACLLALAYCLTRPRRVCAALGFCRRPALPSYRRR